MKPLLPVVDPDVGFSIANSLDDESNQTWRKHFDRIRKENPAVAEFIARWADMGKNRVHTAICGLLVYLLLESQAEVDRMNEELRL